MIQKTKSGKFLPKTITKACPLDKWSTKKKEFQGGIAELRKVNSTGKLFVVKILDYYEEDMSPQMWISERRAYERIEKHRPFKYIAEYYGFVKCSSKRQFLFLEWVGNTPLSKGLKFAFKNCSPIEYFWIGLLYYVSKVVCFLEEIGINHRDFHFGNIHIQGPPTCTVSHISVFDFGLSVGTSTPKDPGWTVTDWGGNFRGEFFTSKFVLGFDLHSFLAGLFSRKRKLVPDSILRDLVFPFLKNLDSKERKELRKLDKDDMGPYSKVKFEGKTKIVPSNLLHNWKKTSGRYYHDFLVNKYLKNEKVISLKVKTESLNVWIMTNTKVRKKCLKEFILKGKLGVGCMGTVHEVCKGNDCKYALKVRDVKGRNLHPELFINTFKNEVKFTKEASDLGIAPKLIDSWTCKGMKGDTEVYLGFILMEKWDTTLSDYLKINPELPAFLEKRIRKYKKLLLKHHIGHFDIHDKNIMINLGKDGKPIDVAIIDYDRTQDTRDKRIIDYYEL